MKKLLLPDTRSHDHLETIIFVYIFFADIINSIIRASLFFHPSDRFTAIGVMVTFSVLILLLVVVVIFMIIFTIIKLCSEPPNSGESTGESSTNEQELTGESSTDERELIGESSTGESSKDMPERKLANAYELFIIITEGLGIICYFYGDNIRNITDNYGEELNCNETCQKKYQNIRLLNISFFCHPSISPRIFRYDQ